MKGARIDEKGQEAFGVVSFPPTTRKKGTKRFRHSAHRMFKLNKLPPSTSQRRATKATNEGICPANRGTIRQQEFVADLYTLPGFCYPVRPTVTMARGCKVVTSSGNGRSENTPWTLVEAAKGAAKSPCPFRVRAFHWIREFREGKRTF